MQSNYDYIYETVSIYEGGYVDHPKDPGGATNRGITQATYDGYRRGRDLPEKHVKLISDAEVAQIYREQYWDAVKGDQLPSGVDLAVYDFGVNSGPSRAIRYVQEILGVRADGLIGAITLDAINHTDAESLIVALCEKRMKFLRGLSTFKHFGRGWTRRVVGEMAGAQVTDTGVIDRGVKLARGERAAMPISPAAGKAREEDTKKTTQIAEGIKDNITSITGSFGSGGAGGYLVGSNQDGIVSAVTAPGPLQYAVIGVVAIGAVTAALVALKHFGVIGASA